MPDFLSQSLQKATFAKLQGTTKAMADRVKALSGTQATPDSKLKSMEEEQIDEVTGGFESVFLGMLVKELRKTVEKSNFIDGGSSAMKMYEEMFDEQLVKKLAEQNSLGIGEMVRGQIEEQTANTHAADSDFVKQRLAEQAALFEKIKKD